MPEATTSLVDHVDHVLGPTIDHATDAVADTVGHGIAAIADSHIPIFTIGRAVYRAKAATDAGLEAGRVRENFALDAGVTGGAVATGAAVGTMIFPVVGTIVGGVLGGLLGRGLAATAKQRYLVRAQEHANLHLQSLGETVSAASWLTISDEMADCVSKGQRALSALTADWTNSKRTMVPSRLGRWILRFAIETGAADLALLRADLAEWEHELRETAFEKGSAFRGAVLAIRPDIAQRFDTPTAKLDDVIEANKAVQEERKKLALA